MLDLPKRTERVAVLSFRDSLMLLELRHSFPSTADRAIPCTFASFQVLQLVVQIGSLGERQRRHSVPLLERI